MQEIRILYIIFICFMLTMSTEGTAKARVYAYIDSNRILHKPPIIDNAIHMYSNNKYDKTLFNSSNKEDGHSGYDSSFPSIDAIIEFSALKNGIDPSLVWAVIKTESNFHTNSISPKGAQGLMQLMPETARELHVSDPFDPKQNIAGGTKYLRSLLDNYNGKIELSLAAYNAGPGHVKDRIPNISETKQYVSEVMGHYKKYRMHQRSSPATSQSVE